MDISKAINAKGQNSGNLIHLLVGGYTDKRQRGIMVFRFDAEYGRLTYVNESSAIENPSYLCLDTSGQLIYAVSEREDCGAAYAYTFDDKTGVLTLNNEQPVGGTAACYITVDKKRKHVFIANYKSGNLSVLPLNGDGSLLPPIQWIQDAGNSIKPDRQEGPHVHSALLSRDEQFLLYTDLGTDKIYCYSYQNEQQLPLSLHSVTELRPGSGPRQMAFSADGRYLYVVTELSGDVIVFAYDAGCLMHVQIITMLADDFQGDPGGGDILLSADGLFVYASNRGDANEIIVYAVNRSNGTLTFRQRQPCMGKSPRNLLISSGGDHLLVSNQESNNIVVFKRDSATGIIGRVLSVLNTPQPSCLKFII